MAITSFYSFESALDIFFCSCHLVSPFFIETNASRGCLTGYEGTARSNVMFYYVDNYSRLFLSCKEKSWIFRKFPRLEFE